MPGVWVVVDAGADKMRGWRAKLGLIVPSTNSTMEPDFCTLAPAGVTVHTARLKTQREATFDTLRKMEELVIPAAVSLADCEVNSICYGCTSGSFVEGPTFAQRIEANIKKETGIEAATTATAMVESMMELNLKKVAVVSPYIEKTNERLISFVAYYGIQVVALKAFDMIDQFEHANISAEAIYRLARTVDLPEADGVFIACTQLPSIDVAAVLEKDLGKPVIAATAATMWLALKKAGVKEPQDGYGEILKRL